MCVCVELASTEDCNSSVLIHSFIEHPLETVLGDWMTNIQSALSQNLDARREGGQEVDK